MPVSESVVNSRPNSNSLPTVVLNCSLDYGGTARDILSPLGYIDVRVAEVPTDKVFAALADSGSEINIVHRRLLGSYAYQVCGQVMLRGIVGESITADLTYLTLSPAECPQNEVRAICAISEK